MKKEKIYDDYCKKKILRIFNYSTYFSLHNLESFHDIQALPELLFNPQKKTRKRGDLSLQAS